MKAGTCRFLFISNIETIIGEVEDPLFPDDELDMVFIVNAFHDLAKPVELLNNIVPSLKPGAPVVIIDRDPSKFRDRARHNLYIIKIVQKGMRTGKSVEDMRKEDVLKVNTDLWIVSVYNSYQKSIESWRNKK